MSRPISVAVSCTDKGQHAWISLGDLTLDGEVLRANIGAVYGEIAERRKADAVWIDEYGKAHFRCPRCGRNPALRRDKMLRIIAALWDVDHAGGMAKLDISALP